jgi:signal transduction histidine kinase/ActR/RegA family two-component response regulator
MKTDLTPKAERRRKEVRPRLRIRLKPVHAAELLAEFMPTRDTDDEVRRLREALVRKEDEVRRLREALIRGDRMRAIGELASGVVHDLNRALHAMALRVSLIEESDACRTAQGSNIESLSRAINDAALTSGRLEDFLADEPTGNLDERWKGSFDLMDVSAVTADAIEMVRTTIEGESSLLGTPVRIRTDLRPTPTVDAPASDLRHMVVNLLLDARDMMSKGGTIEVTTEERGGRVILDVGIKDEGSGIPEKDLANIFEPFLTPEGTGGRGLGHSNARTALARAGVEISASNRPTGGACFTLAFPLVRSAQPSAGAGLPSAVPRGRRILVIDDDGDNLQATKMVLELQDQSVDLVQSGTEAIARVRAGLRYDLVLCDLGMPDMNGWRVAREIQEIAPGTLVYILTGWAQEIREGDPRRQWVRGVLQRPMDQEMILDLLADVERRAAAPAVDHETVVVDNIAGAAFPK